MSKENGISIGLNINKKKPNLPLAKKPRMDSSDEDENPKTKDDIKKIINEKIKREQEANYLKSIDAYSKNIEEDPNIYEYDTIYNEISTEAQRKKMKEKIASDKPKYLGNIIAASEKRKVEQSITIENIEKKRREREKNELEEVPKFITKGYEEKMALNRLKHMKHMMEEKYDKLNSIENKEMGMMGFYSNLLTKNKSLGTGFRGEAEQQDDKMLQMYHERKHEFSRLIDNKVSEIEEEKELKNKKKFKDEKDEVIKEIKQQTEVKKVQSTTIENEENKNKIDNISKVDEIKKRYLDRKRHRDEDKTQNTSTQENVKK